jgi:membrane protein
MMDRLRALGRRWPWFDKVLDVHERVGDVRGGFMASAITINVFLALFPLLLVVIAIVGFFAKDDPTIANDIIRELGLSGDAAETMNDAITKAADSARAASIIGLLGLLWSGLNVVAAVEEGIRAPWQEKGAGMKAKFVGVGWLFGASAIFLASVALGAILNFLPEEVPKGVISAGVIIIGLLVEFGVFLWTFWLLGNHKVGIRPLIPGAVVAAIGFEILKLVGTVMVPQLVKSSSALYGPIGVVFAILAWLALIARLLVYSSAVNAVNWEESHGTVNLSIQVPNLPHDEPAPEATRGGTAVPAEDSEDEADDAPDAGDAEPDVARRPDAPTGA